MKRLLCAVPALALLLAPALAGAQADTLPSDRQLRQRAGYGIARVDAAITDLQGLRAHVEQMRAGLSARVTADSLAEIPGPPVVLDWRTGEWEMLVGGYRGILDIENSTATVAGVTAPVEVAIAGDTLRLFLSVPGYEDGAVEVVHAEGRLIGTVAVGDSVRPASGQRAHIQVVRTVLQEPCTFAEYTDGSWGVGPVTGACHQALDEFTGGLTFVARDYSATN